MILKFAARLCYSSALVLLLTVGAQELIAQTAGKMGVAEASASGDDAKKAQILASDRWQKMLGEFHQWLSVQVVYTPEQVEQIKAKLKAQVQSMSAAELEQFLDQWDAKLKVLLGKDAAEARKWLGENFQVMADGYRKQFMQQLGLNRDISTLTAAQLEDEIEKMRAQRLTMQQDRAFFDYTRQQKLQVSQQLQDASSTAMQNAGQGQAAEFGQFQSQYSPRQYESRPAPLIMPFWW